MKSAAKILNPFELPLYGHRLIEASAGTGKTYTLVLLYLRLLLGLGAKNNAFPRLLTVDEILVVTFTEAATEELRGRIREKIHQLRIACLRAETQDPVLAELLSQITDLSWAASVLLIAEQQIDQAAIYTIHGFCQRMLAKYALEADALFRQQLIDNEQQIKQQACADFWRRYFYPVSQSIANEIFNLWPTPDKLLTELAPYLANHFSLLKEPSDPFDIEQQHQKNIACIDALKQQWRQYSDVILPIIIHSGVNKRSYSQRHLPNWFAVVTEWAQTQTKDYSMPDKVLGHFAQCCLAEKTPAGACVPEHPLFSAIEQFLADPPSLRPYLFNYAMIEINKGIAQEKHQKNELGFDDLLIQLANALKKDSNKKLANAILQCYPVAMIDEFQDTDDLQYTIFMSVYPHDTQHGLLLIGDPKQAIYSFRGADIFAYIRAKQEIADHYTLLTNWRSSARMIAAVNAIFSQSTTPFIFDEINFSPAIPSGRASHLGFQLNSVQQSAIHVFHQPQAQRMSKTEYEKKMAEQCAMQIYQWLSAAKTGKAILIDQESSRILHAGDITVLVRNRNEAKLIRQALMKRHIPSVFLSNRESVFATQEAKEIYWLLQAVLFPEKTSLLRCALSSTLLGFTAHDIEQLNGDERAWNKLVTEFISYREHWLKWGILSLIRDILLTRNIAVAILSTTNGERKLTDILHISELLQEASQYQDNEYAVLRWLAQQILHPNHEADVQQLRLESEKNLIKIMTIHKSKGLEFPLVLLPFICNYRQSASLLYHDRETLLPCLDLANQQQTASLVEEERLAEDLRLLYVALTRSIYHCSLGIAPLVMGNRAKSDETDLHLTAIGYLLQKGQMATASALTEYLSTFIGEHIDLVRHENETAWLAQHDDLVTTCYQAKSFKRQFDHQWRITSYSELQKADVYSAYVPHLTDERNLIASYFLKDKQQINIEQDTIHHFPKGALAGSFLHFLLEYVMAEQPIDQTWIETKLLAYGFSIEWAPNLMAWLTTILDAPLNESQLKLAAINQHERLIELAFHFSIKNVLSTKMLDALVRQYDAISYAAPAISTKQLHGMMKGFIDLVFYWQGRYYLLDYKSNWLGETNEDYQLTAMQQAMSEHRYDLQYQLYTLALHRYLQQRLPNYCYEKHFGGVFYLFLRGLNQHTLGQGVFFCRPVWQLIDKLDQLFAGEGKLE